eukprot:SAG11_NODE_23860_length_382_cov_0.710247_1_plen_23_part_01
MPWPVAVGHLAASASECARVDVH